MPAYSGSFSGSFSGSYIGNGSQLVNIDYYTLQNLPQTISNFNKNSITANSAFKDNFTTHVKTRLNAETVVSSSAQMSASMVLEGFGRADDAQPLLWSRIINLPSGIVSSSVESLVGSDLVVASITAERYIVSSSITHMTTSFSSGSTIFGDSLDDTHQITGSLSITGSINFILIDGGSF